MLNRFLMALLLMPFAFAGFAAQLTATLQSGDKVTPFYGADAFVNAYNAAVEGDVITLSPGEFNTTEVNKGVTIIGAYAFSEDTSECTVLKSFTVSADNVTLEGLRITASFGLKIKGANHLTISRCYIAEIWDYENGERKYHDNTIHENCIIETYNAMSLSKNAVFKNCCVDRFWDKNESSYPALIENCNITEFASWYKTSLDSDYVRQPYAIYRNCLLGLYSKEATQHPTLYLQSPSEFHSVLFVQNVYETPSSYSAKSWEINYNSCIKDNVIKYWLYNVTSTALCLNYNSLNSYTCSGLTVGPSDVKQYPAIPEITSAEIDTQTDAEGNLHIKISACARD